MPAPIAGHQGASGNASPPGTFHPHGRTILSVTLANDTFEGGAPSGTVVGAISVAMSSGTFGGSLSLSGSDAADFQIVGSNLETNGVVAAGSYDINIVASQAGVSNSPVTQPETITGSGGGYTGPLDIQGGAVVAYSSARALSSAMRGSAIYTITRTSDGSTLPVNSDAVTGSVPQADIVSFIGSGTIQQTGAVSVGDVTIDLEDATGVAVGQIVAGANIPALTLVMNVSGLIITISDFPTGDNAEELLTFTQGGLFSALSDQSGNGADVTNDGAVFVASQQNEKPAMRCINDFSLAGSFSVPNNSGGYTCFVVSPYGFAAEIDDSNNGGYTFIEGTSGNNPTHNTCDAGDTDHNETGGVKDLPQDNEIHIFEFAWEFGTKVFLLDGVSQGFTTDSDSGEPLGNVVLDAISALLIGQTGNGDTTKGGFELIVWPQLLDSVTRDAIRQNIAAFYDITLP